MSDTVAPVLAGAVAGCIMTVVGHPFDTLKVRMQTASSSVYSSTWACAKQTVSAEGFLALYKGLQPALLTTCVTSGLRFGVQHRFNDGLVAMLRPASDHKLLRRRSSAATPTISPHASFDQLSVTARVLAEGGGGAACGLVLPLIFTPLELIKIRRQVLQDNSLTNLQIFRTIWREKGLGGLYTGYRFTVVRSTFGNAALFGSFEAWKSLLRMPYLTALGSGEERPWATSVLAGVLSGWTTQLVIFPVDAAKSRVQASKSGGFVCDGGGGGGMLPALVTLWREGTLYRGRRRELGPCGSGALGLSAVLRTADGGIEQS